MVLRQTYHLIDNEDHSLNAIIAILSGLGGLEAAHGDGALSLLNDSGIGNSHANNKQRNNKSCTHFSWLQIVPHTEEEGRKSFLPVGGSAQERILSSFSTKDNILNGNTLLGGIEGLLPPVNETIGGRIMRGNIINIVNLRLDNLGELLAELNAPLVE